jgi:chromosome segregation ATPase
LESLRASIASLEARLQSSEDTLRSSEDACVDLRAKIARLNKDNETVSEQLSEQQSKLKQAEVKVHIVVVLFFLTSFTMLWLYQAF